MTNDVQPYDLPDAKLGSFVNDRRAFSLLGPRTDVSVQRDILALYIRIRDLYRGDDHNALDAAFREETVLTHLIIEGESHPVYVRAQGQASIAFFAYRLANGSYRTLILGADANPPPDGLQTWWRRSIRPRLCAFLGV